MKFLRHAYVYLTNKEIIMELNTSHLKRYEKNVIAEITFEWEAFTICKSKPDWSKPLKL